jgi:threonylcarbamoyladenosine tRNA methylthiotransferase MtaB
MKTVKFYTLGCKVNQYETQVIREQFQKAGFLDLEDGMQARVCVINTCTVTHQADRRSVYLIRRARRQNPSAKIVVTGCMTQLDANRISSIPGVDLIVKNKDKYKIPALLNVLPTTHNPQRTTHNAGRITQNAQRITQSGITHFKNHARAFLKVQDGCNYNCSYCKVRIVRGKSRSRALEEIKQEVTNLVRNGYLEIVLSGVCLGSYGLDLIPRINLVKLIKELQSIPAYFRIRLSSIEVNDITEDLLNIVRNSKRLCPHLHIPVQSGDEQILNQMNRAYSAEQYIRLIEHIRRYMPEIAITTDVIVGFSGETEENFNNTLELIRKIQPLRVHIFPYSKRLHTPAYSQREAVPDSQIKLRIAILQEVSRGLRLVYCQKFINRVCQVLVEGRVSGCPDLWEGYTGNYIKVRVKSNAKLQNQIIQVKLKEIHDDFVLGDIV